MVRFIFLCSVRLRRWIKSIISSAGTEVDLGEEFFLRKNGGLKLHGKKNIVSMCFFTWVCLFCHINASKSSFFFKGHFSKKKTFDVFVCLQSRSTSMKMEDGLRGHRRSCNFSTTSSYQVSTRKTKNKCHMQ